MTLDQCLALARRCLKLPKKGPCLAWMGAWRSGCGNFQTSFPQATIAKAVNKRKAWVNALLRGVPKKGVKTHGKKKAQTTGNFAGGVYRVGSGSEPARGWEKRSIPSTSGQLSFTEVVDLYATPAREWTRSNHARRRSGLIARSRRVVRPLVGSS